MKNKEKELYSGVIQSQCFLVSRQLEDIGVPQKVEPARFVFNRFEVESIREVFNDISGEPEEDEVMLYFKSGSSIVIKSSFDDAMNQIFSI